MFEIPEDLVKSLREGLIVPFVGAGVSMAVRDRTRSEPLFPRWKELPLKAADCLDQQRKPELATAARALLERG